MFSLDIEAFDSGLNLGCVSILYILKYFYDFSSLATHIED